MGAALRALVMMLSVVLPNAFVERRTIALRLRLPVSLLLLTFLLLRNLAYRRWRREVLLLLLLLRLVLLLWQLLQGRWRHALLVLLMQAGRRWSCALLRKLCWQLARRRCGCA
jgi:hypothetical protein